ncbi:hypothetical protein HID58_047564 [Brassica napus]|uniref:Uncharacterized protein n=1 Tax=Brassica napus TaxID=3708 RepID=A0ABQ8B123_BRANA|nr:hypothetical protein HID58_047564 [Brassica napus]
MSKRRLEKLSSDPELNTSSRHSEEPRGRKTLGSEDPAPYPNRFQIVRSAVVTQVREIRALRLCRSVGEKRPCLKGEQPEEPPPPLMVPSSANEIRKRKRGGRPLTNRQSRRKAETMTMRSAGKSPVVLYFKAISAESELLPSSSSCDLCCSPIPKDHHPPAYCLPVRTRFLNVRKDEFYLTPANYIKELEETMLQINIDEFKLLLFISIFWGISKSIYSEEESSSYKRAVLSVVEKTLDMIYQKSSSLSKVARVCNSVVITYTIIDLIAWLAKLKVAYQFYLEPPTFIGNTYGMLQAADTFYLISVVHILGRNRLEINPTIRPGAAPTAPDMRVRLSQIEPDFLTRSVIFLYCLNHH